jgi:hypothetical protein
MVNTRHYHLYSVDQCWKPIQRRDNWFIIYPCMSIQLPNYSDILHTQVDYTKYFSIENN